ncbi:MAG: hypothetical protein PVG39_16275 [Desulfobacteraceae bacterium]|jgi:hypothetical protein
MFKKLVKITISIGALLAASTGVDAAEYNINIYGAKAQYTYWSEAAPAFLYQKCNTTVQWAKDAADKQGISYCDDYDTTHDEVYIRYASKASYDGLYAVSGQDPLGNSGICADNERMMADETNTNFGDYEPEGEAPEGVTGYACKDITVAASDNDITGYDQESHGLRNGPSTAGNIWFDGEMKDLAWPPGFTPTIYNPFAIPYSFFRNANSTTSPNIDNIGLVYASLIFSGQITDWMTLDPTLTSSIPMVVCMRHAGSDSVAHLNAAVMSKSSFSLVKDQVLTTDISYIVGASPAIYFNRESSDMMRCVGGAGSREGYENYDGIGAIGYGYTGKVIVDGITGEYHDVDGFGDIKLMSYANVYLRHNELVSKPDCFENYFWYYSLMVTDGSDPGGFVTALKSFAYDPANMPGYMANYMATCREMKARKDTPYSDPSPASYPPLPPVKSSCF